MGKITYLGIPGSFSFIAAQKYFGRKIAMLSSNTIKDVFKHLANKRADYGVVPVENSTTGSILETYDQLLESKLSISGEIILKIHHQLLVHKKQTNITSLKTVYSHPQAILQCENFLSNYPALTPAFTSDTASAAEIIAKRNKSAEAAISGNEAAEIYGLKILAKNIEDNKNNFTRFVVISRQRNQTGNKISLAFSIAHVPGSLFRTLKAYAENNLNLTKIESRPVFGKPWEYIFFIDFEIRPNQKKQLKLTLTEMKENCRFINILGRYQKGKIYET